jgi:hypothetical protein
MKTSRQSGSRKSWVPVLRFIHALSAVLVGASLQGCISSAVGLAGAVHCPNTRTGCVAPPGATLTFTLPPPDCSRGATCSYLASIPEDQPRSPSPTDKDHITLYRTSIWGHVGNKLTIMTDRSDVPAKYYVEVRYAPASLVGPTPYRIVVAYQLQPTQTQ